MKRIECGCKSWVMLLLLDVIMIAMGGISPVQAEPPVHLSPGNILGSLLSSAVDAFSEPAPLKVQRACSHEIEECWIARGLNKENIDKVSDACWRESKRCPKICKDEYFSRRKAGAGSSAADPLFYGPRGEDSSCVPGLDKLMHAGQKVKPNNSTLRVSVSVGGKAVSVEVRAVPVDGQGHKKKRTTSSPNYSKSSIPDVPFGPVSLYVPAGRYQLRVLSPERIYHPSRAFPEQLELVRVKAGQTLDKVYTFGMGHLVVKAQTAGGRPVAATLELKRPNRPSYVLLRVNLPLDSSLLAGKYKLVISETKTRRSKSVNIEITDGKLTSRTILFDDGSR